jgi:SM-20-related protein
LWTVKRHQGIRAVSDDVTTAVARPEASTKPARPQAPTITRMDNVLRDDQRKAIDDLLRGPGWKFGWKSKRNTDEFSFWHKHFAGPILSDRVSQPDQDEPVSCAEELAHKAPAIHLLWTALEKTALKGHVLVRSYANGHTYGSDGTVHTDSASPRSFTTLYYPHERWSPNWGGETVFFNPEETDIIAAIYPRPNRLIVFPGALPHVARGVSRICPILRITLMFKTELWNG